MELFLFQFLSSTFFEKSSRTDNFRRKRFGTLKGGNKTKNLDLVKNVVVRRKGSVRDGFSKKVVEKIKGSIDPKIRF
jgi:hypothetical protein